MTQLDRQNLKQEPQPTNLYRRASAQASLIELTWLIAERIHDQTSEGKAQLQQSLVLAETIIRLHQNEPWLLPICAKSPLLLKLYRNTQTMG